MRGDEGGGIVVVGGTGRVGSRLCALLREAGREPVVASPSTGVDTTDGEGLEAAVRGARAVVDVSNPRAWGAAEILDYFRTSTRNLLAAEEAARVRHHVVLSVVGCDLVLDSAYFRAKAAQERAVQAGPIPFTILRATQFFEFIEGIVESASDGDLVRLPPAEVRPVAVSDVAAVLAELALAEPTEGIVELAGPESFTMSEVARQLLAARGDPRTVVEDPGATYFGATLGRRTLVPRGEARLGGMRFAEWLRGKGSE